MYSFEYTVYAFTSVPDTRYVVKAVLSLRYLWYYSNKQQINEHEASIRPVHYQNASPLIHHGPPSAKLGQQLHAPVHAPLHTPLERDAPR